MIYFAFVGLLLWWAIVFTPWRAWSTRESLVPLPDFIVQPLFETITVLIPARNEGQVIAQTLSALLAQNGNLRIFVIDDQSEDNTALIARQHGATVITGTTPPPNWSVKLWALQQGLQAVQTRYTLLLDADITLAPGTLAALLLHARKNDLTLVSLMATLSVKRFAERLLIPAFIFFFKLLYPFSLANNPTSRVAAAAGGCILVETAALKSVNTFESIHDTLIDDCTLAAKIKQTGHKTWIGLSHGVYSHRSYDNLAQIWNMVARTAFTQLNYSLVLLLACTLIMTSMFWMAPALAIICADAVCLAAWILTWIAMWIVFTPTLKFYQRSPLWTATLPLIGTLYLLMTWTSAFHYWRGKERNGKTDDTESPNMIKNIFYVPGLIFLLLITTITLARSEEQTHSEEPQRIVVVLQNALIKAMQQGKEMSYHDRESFLAPVIQQTHDLEAIVRTILGAHWTTLEKAQQQVMLSTFAQNSIAIYADRFDQYDGECFEIIENQLLPRGRMLVRSQFIKADQGIISFDYVLHQQNEHWRIINVVVDGVSDLALKRAEYNAIVQQEGIQSLISMLQNKTNQIKLDHQQ